jgi:hypothetical protein
VVSESFDFVEANTGLTLGFRFTAENAESTETLLIFSVRALFLKLFPAGGTWAVPSAVNAKLGCSWLA